MARFILIFFLLSISLRFYGECPVSGCFVDVNNQAIRGGIITFVHIDAKNGIKTITDSLGNFKMELPEGNYKFRFEAPGYKTLKGSIQLMDDNKAELGNIVMRLDDTILQGPQRIGQYIISGRVTESTDNPIEFAAIRFMMADTTFVSGTSTDSLGRFTASLPAIGEYQMMVSALGYIPENLSVKLGQDSLVIAPVILKNNNELTEVTVSAGYMNRVNNHLLIIPEKILVKHATTGYQLLNNLMLPGIDVDVFDGIVRLYGHDVSLYINGQPADYRMIQNLRPKDVQKIEYHDAPIGRYATDFAAINFITKEQRTGGYVTLDAQQTIGGYLDGKYNGFSKINNGNTSYYVFAGYNLKSAAADRETKKEAFELQSSNIIREFNSLTGRNRNHGEYGQFTMQHATSRRFISVSTGIVSDLSKSALQGLTAYYAPLNINQRTFSDKKNKAISPKFSYYGQFNLREKDQLITTLNTSYSHSRYNYDYTTTEELVYSDTRDNVFNLQTQLLYQMELRHCNSISFILMNALKNASTEYIGTYGSKQKMWNSETLAFVEYTQRISNRLRFTARPGLSIVNMSLNEYEQKNFYFPRFFTQITYNPARRQQINLSISIGNAMASLSSRTAAEQPIDLIMSRKGNPDLKDVKLYDANVNYSIQLGNVNLNSLLALTYNSDALTAGYIPDNNRLIINVYNGKFKRARFSANASWKISDNLRGELGGELSSQSYGNNLYMRHLNCATASLCVIYFIRDFSFTLKGNTVSRGLNSEYIYSFTPANAQFTASWTHGNWRVDAWTKSLSRQTLKRYIDVPNYRMHQLSHGRFCGMVKVAYSFDFGHKIQREHKKADNSIDSNILK